MAQGLIVSDSELVNDIYAANLSVYVAMEMAVALDAEQAIGQLEKNPQTAIIISAWQDQSKNALAKVVYQYLQKTKRKTPLMVVGAAPQELAGTISLPNLYDLKAVVRAVAKLLDTSAKDMAALAVPEYYPIALKVLEGLEKTPAPVYLKRAADDYILVMDSGDPWEGKLKKYREEGIEFLHVPASKRLACINAATSRLLRQMAEQAQGTADKLNVAEQGIELVASQVTKNEDMTEDLLELSRACVENVKSAIRDIPKVKGLMGQLLANKSSYVYAHSILGSYVCAHIIKTISWGGEGQKEKLAFVMFFHDIFLVPLFNKYPHFFSEEEMLFSDDLSDDEKEIVLNHARFAADLVRALKHMPMGADNLIMQHHGATHGNEFPVTFKDDISPLAKVIVVAEAFVEKLWAHTKETPNQPFGHQQVLEKLRQRFGKSSYKKIVDTLETLTL